MKGKVSEELIKKFNYEYCPDCGALKNMDYPSCINIHCELGIDEMLERAK